MSRSNEMNRPLPFFATPSDIRLWLDDFSTEHHLAYTLAGMFDEPSVSTYPTLDSVPNLGHSATGNQITDPCYLIHATNLPIAIREIPQRRGSIRYSIDQRINVETIGIKFGGLFNEQWLIAGQLGMATEHTTSARLQNELVRKLKCKFAKIRSYWVGPAAEQTLDNGGRLVVNSLASMEYDLARA